MNKKYYVSRQCYWPDGNNVVEIAMGGSDYANPDQLVDRFSKLGEGHEFEDPREAVSSAINVLEAWRKLCPDKEIEIAYGYTGGNTMPFDPSPIEEIETWADKQYAKLPKCDRCHELLTKDSTYQYADGFSPDEKYCSEFCLEKAAEQFAEEEDV